MKGGRATNGSRDDFEDEEVAKKVRASLAVHSSFWPEAACLDIEAEVDGLSQLARGGRFRAKTLDRTPLRSKYFFGYGYTYGSQISKKGEEQILPPELIDPVPDWIYLKLILPLEEKGLVPEGWLNSAVVNDYRPGGMIVSHIDPPKLFARPIFITSFFAEGRLVFGSRFSFPNKGGAPETTSPKCVCPMPRGSLTVMDGFSADGITHGIRPQDLDGRRVSIVLRHVFPNAPRVPQPPTASNVVAKIPLPLAASAAPAWGVESALPEAREAGHAGHAGEAGDHVACDRGAVAVRAAPKAEEEIDEFGRRRRKPGGKVSYEGETCDSGIPRAGTAAMSEKQRAALARLQKRKTKGSRSRSIRR